MWLGKSGDAETIHKHIQVACQDKKGNPGDSSFYCFLLEARTLVVDKTIQFKSLEYRACSATVLHYHWGDGR